MLEQAAPNQGLDLELVSAVVRESTDSILITEGGSLDQPGPRIVYVNPAFERQTGYSFSEMLGKTPRMLQGPLSNRESLSALKSALVRGKPARVETTNYRKDGSWYDTELSIYPIRRPEGHVTHWVGVARDISQRRQEERIRRAEHRALEQMARGAAVPEVLGSIAQGVEASAPGRWCVMHEVDDAGSLQLLAAGATPPTLQRTLQSLTVSAGCCPIERALSSGSPVIDGALGGLASIRFEVEPGQSESLGSVWSYPVIDSAQHVVSVLSVLGLSPGTPTEMEDSTIRAAAHIAGVAIERIRTRDERRHLERQLQLVTDNLPALICYMGSDLRYRFVNRPYASFRDLEPSDLIGKRVEDVLGDEIFRELEPKLRAALRGNEIRFEYCFAPPGAEPRYLLSTYVPQRLDDGTVEGVVALILDVTEHRKADRELARYREHLEALVSERTRELEQTHEQLRQADRLVSIGTLAAGVGHDLANILLPMRCRIDVLDQAGLPEELEEELDSLRGSIDFLARLGHGLKMCAMDPESARGVEGVTDLARWWAEVGSLLERSAPDQIELCFEAHPDVPPAAIAPHQLTQAVLNLVVNAVEATEGGGHVTIQATSDSDRTCVRISVADDGCGMSEDIRRRALDPFFTTKKRGRSTGLGLSLVHSVISSVGGSVELCSALGEGTTVTCVIPAGQSSQGGIASNGDLPPRHVVISIEDARQHALMVQMAQASGLVLRDNTSGNPGDAEVWVCDQASASRPTIERFLDSNSSRTVLLLGEPPEGVRSPSVHAVDPSNGLEGIRRALRRVMAGERSES